MGILFSNGDAVFHVEFVLAIAFSHFWKRRATFAKHLQNSDSALTTSRYFRLMGMAMVEVFFGLLVTSLNMWWTMRFGLRPCLSWEDVHFDWLEVAYFPLSIIFPHGIGLDIRPVVHDTDSVYPLLPFFLPSVKTP